MIDVVLYAQDNNDRENYPWLLELYRTGLNPFKEEYELDGLNQNQMDILIKYLIEVNSYGEDTDPQNLDDLIQYDILIPINNIATSTPVKSKKHKKKKNED